MSARRASRESVVRWNAAYAELTSALLDASQAEVVDAPAVARVADAYMGVAVTWLDVIGQPDIPMWARHAATVAAEEFTRRADLERRRITGEDG